MQRRKFRLDPHLIADFIWYGFERGGELISLNPKLGQLLGDQIASSCLLASGVLGVKFARRISC